MSALTAPIPVVVDLPAGHDAASRRAAGLSMALISALAFSASGPLMKPLFESGWSLSSGLVVRMGVAGLILSPVLIRAVLRQPHFVRSHGLVILIFGLTAVLGCQLLFFAAMQRMPVAVALLIQYLAPVMLVLFVWMRTRRAPSRLVLFGAVTALVGLVLVVDVSGAGFDLLGTMMAFGAALCVCVYFVISERAGHDLPPLALASGGLLVGAVAMMLLGITGLMPFAAPRVEVTFPAIADGVTLPWFVPLLLVAAVSTTLGYALGVGAVPRIGTRVASFVGLSEVLFALGFAWLLLAEVPAAVQFVGGALILLGVVLVRMDAEATAVAIGDSRPVGNPAEPTLPAVPAP